MVSPNEDEYSNDDDESDPQKHRVRVFHLSSREVGHRRKRHKHAKREKEEPPTVEVIELAEMQRERSQSEADEEVIQNTGGGGGGGAQRVQQLPDIIGDLVYNPIRSALSLLRKVLIPFIFGGLSQVGAGLLLNSLLSNWEVFREMPHLVAAISPLLGTLSSIKGALSGRLTEEANQGALDRSRWTDLKSVLLGNLKVVNCQAAVLSLITALVSIGFSALREESRRRITWQSALVACSGTVSTSVIVNCFLTTILGVIVLVARRCGLNTDSILCSLLVSLLRDLSSLGLLAFITTKLEQNAVPLWLHALISLTPALLLAPLAGYYAFRNHFTRSVILYCWPPLVMAVLLEAPGGLTAAINFHLHPLASALQPVVNGVALNAISIQAGAVSINLKAQMQAQNRKLLRGVPYRNLLSPFCSRADLNSRIAHLLLSVSLPAQLFNLSLLYIFQLHSSYQFYLTAPFIGAFILSVFLQVAFTAEVAHVAVYLCARLGYDPDNAARPLIAAVCNLTGNCAMAVMFAFLSAVHDDNITWQGSGSSNSSK